MKNINTGDTTYRNALLKTCMKKGMPASSIAKITTPMRGKPNAEKERIAQAVLKQLEE